MVSRNPSQDVRVMKVFKKKKVLMIEELSRLLGSSLVTARRRLKQWKAYTSFNQNGRYYVLPDVAKFNTYGLWRHQDILFSQHGNLKQTVIALVKNSPAGLAGSQIGELVSLAPRSFLSHFRNESQLRREMIEGRFVYFASDKATCIQQKKNLQEQTNPSDMHAPTDAEAVVILVERIKYSGLSIEDLAKKLRKVGYRFSAEAIRRFLDSHGLLKKKLAISSSGR
jgi:hypothetical protein